jgi:hypothetical protein
MASKALASSASIMVNPRVTSVGREFFKFNFLRSSMSQQCAERDSGQCLLAKVLD